MVMKLLLKYRVTLASPVYYSGSDEDYSIDYGNGLRELGGIVQIECTRVTSGIIEA